MSAGSHTSTQTPASPTLSVTPADTLTIPPGFWGDGTALGAAIAGGCVSATSTETGGDVPAYVSSYAFPLASAVKTYVPAGPADSVQDADRKVPSTIVPKIAGFAPETSGNPGGMFRRTVVPNTRNPPGFATFAVTRNVSPWFTFGGATTAGASAGAFTATGSETPARANGSTPPGASDPRTPLTVTLTTPGAADGNWTCSTLSRGETDVSSRAFRSSSYSHRSRSF